MLTRKDLMTSSFPFHLLTYRAFLLYLRLKFAGLTQYFKLEN